MATLSGKHRTATFAQGLPSTFRKGSISAAPGWLIAGTKGSREEQQAITYPESTIMHVHRDNGASPKVLTA